MSRKLNGATKNIFYRNFGSHFVHDDFSASAGPFWISFSHKASKRTQVGINGPRVSYKGPSRPQSRLKKHKNKSPESRQVHVTHKGKKGEETDEGQNILLSISKSVIKIVELLQLIIDTFWRLFSLFLHINVDFIIISILLNDDFLN